MPTTVKFNTLIRLPLLIEGDYYMLIIKDGRDTNSLPKSVFVFKSF